MTTQNALAIARVRRMLADGSATTHRERVRVTRTEVADALGVSAATVSRWESGTRTPSTQHALAYAELMALLGESEQVPA